MASPWYDHAITQDFKWTPQNPAAHSGIDLAADIGTPVTALLPGYVISLGYEPWGWQVNLQHEWPSLGQIVVSYLHGSRVPVGLRAGSQVKPGQLVMYSGTPPSPRYGNGPHIHFEVSRGTQPPYMGHNGPSNPIAGYFLLNAAKNGDLGNVNTSAPAAAISAATGTTAQIAAEPFGPAFGKVCLALEAAGTFQQIPEFDFTNPFKPLHNMWLNLSALMFRGVIMFVGLAIIALCLVNLIRGATAGSTVVPVPSIPSPGGRELPPINPASIASATP